MQQPTSHRSLLLGVVVIVTLLLFLLQPLLGNLLPPQEVLQTWIATKGIMGWCLYLLFGIVSEFFVPLTFAIPGILGGYVYGFGIASVTNWLAKMIGSIIAFYLGKYLGHKILPLFGARAEELYHDFVDRYGLIWAYFLFSYVPFTPGDTMTYFVGAARVPFWKFFIIRSIGSIGTAVALAYIGAGNSLADPVPLLVLSFGFVFVWITLRYFLGKK